MKPTRTADELENCLNTFDAAERSAALSDLASQHQEGLLAVEPEKEVVNMHCHTFFSFNAYGYSPSGLAWLAKKKGYELLGIVDFDVLDAVDEFLDACLVTGVRGAAALETRVYIPGFATREINSPGEPGVFYYMGIGFTSSQAPEAAVPILDDMRNRAKQRNLAIIERINAHLSPVEIDYQRDVLPLTPAGNATERHILAAYTKAAADHFADPTPFWAEKLNLPVEKIADLMKDTPVFQNTVRSKLMKRGGVGYTQPGPDTFPTVEEVNQMILACEALPCATWLDGTLAGEQAMEELLELLIAKGAAAINIIPDRNWNIADPDVRKTKVNNLYQVVELARKFDLPIVVGTEMNAFGQKLVDDFDQAELVPLHKDFMDGAYFIYGHTMMQRAAGLGYQSEWARTHLPSRRERNAFYTQFGRQTPPSEESLARIRQMSPTASPADFLKSG